MLKRNRIELAQHAYNKKDLETTKLAHSPQAIKAAQEEHTKERGKYIGDFVYGALDGIITTFAVVSGVEGARLSNTIILILGFANLLADGVSMAVGNYLSTKSQLQYIKKEREREEWEIDHYPEGEIEEIRQIYKKKGLKGKDLESVVKVITSNKKVWIDTMMLDELGLTEEDKTPFMSGAATFISFVVAGFIPLLVFVLSLFFHIPGQFMISIILTGLVLFVVGAARSWVTGISWLRSGTEMLLVGGVAASIAYFVGFFLRSIGLPG